MFKNWINLYVKLCDTGDEKKLVCPECGQQTIDFQYVGDHITRIEYFVMWCKSCNKGVHLSRVSIPDNRSLISFDAPDETLISRIPDFEEISEQQYNS